MIPIQNVPNLVVHFFDVAQHAKLEYENYMLRVDRESDLEVREAYECAARSAMERANGLKSEAERLLREFEAAGGKVKRDPAWGPATDWVFTPTHRH